MNAENPAVSRWNKFKLLVKVIEVRLRFILILVAVGLLIGYWDTIKNHWDRWTRPAAAAARQLPPDRELFCPMHPNVTRSEYEPDGSMPKCPICGMPLSEHAKPRPEPLPPGVTARVQLSPERIQQAGVRTVEVQYHPLSKQVTTVGTVTYDESRLARVVSRVSGYVEKLYVDKTFMQVREGAPLAEIYSPELYSTAQDLVLSARGSGAADMVQSARRRLALFGVSEEEINTIQAAGRASPRLVLRSPRAGHVIRKNIVAGSKVEDGMALLEVADLTEVWIEADVYEKDIALIRQGQAVEAVVEALPGEVFAGKVALVYPQLDAATRTNRVRFHLANPHGALRPGMYATVRINVPLSPLENTGERGPDKVPLSPWERAGVRGRNEESPASTNSSPGTDPAIAVRSINSSAPSPKPSPKGRGGSLDESVLVVPERAVIDTGTRQVVYLERKPGQFEGVEVQLGPRVGELYPVVKGLAAGDRVAAAGAFLIDAETRLNPGAASTYFGASGGPSDGRPSGATPQTAPRDEAKPQAAPTVEPPEPSEQALKNLAKLSPEDREAALAQGACPITGMALGSMGVPLKIELKGQAVFLCCVGCVDEAKEKADEVLEKVAKFKAAVKARKDKEARKDKKKP